MKTVDHQPDVCLLLEGTYPYISGGVSGWVHELIQEQHPLRFGIVAILPPDADLQFRYSIPDNVVSIQNVILHRLPQGAAELPKTSPQDLFRGLETPLLNLQSRTRSRDFATILKLLRDAPVPLGRRILLDSKAAWIMLQRMYNASMGNTAFLDYFWSWRALMGGLYSIALAELPAAGCYHALCTGFAGLMLARAKQETGHPCLLTEHGIYTNERRIEISAADWLEDQHSLNLSVDRSRFEKSLRDWWMETFAGYSKLCYEACDQIFTLYEGNLELQIEDGADPKKLNVIPNGIDYERYAAIERDQHHPPTVALIGRVVPIKDVKTFIRAISRLKNTVEDLLAWIIGPTDEDPDYFQECRDLVAHAGLDDTAIFTGRVKIDEYLSKIDVIVLTSLSEAQPLVLLEAGAAGIPSVATEVGACREIIEGRSDEDPPLGAGGIVCPLSSPREIAQALERLLRDSEFYQACGQTLQTRVRRYYDKSDQHQAYRDVYTRYLS
jgi:polysaccharide biosynthesis protein PelF